MTTTVRAPAVAGHFYPADPADLAATVDRLLTAASSRGPRPVALVAPHAGYVYSGPIAASAYALLAVNELDWRRVVLLGPSHFVALEGVALSSAEAFRTPLGDVPVDVISLERAARGAPEIRTLDRAHQQEHGLEVQLPFLQRIGEAFEIAPMVCGIVDPDRLADILETVASSPETLVICSTDLSHYEAYDRARALDAETCQAIERLNPSGIAPDRACGSYALAGLLRWAERRDLEVTTLDLRNSGDTAGPKDRVVGYGAWAFD